MSRDVEAVPVECVAKGPEKPLPLPRADPDVRELRSGGDVTPGCDLPDDVEDELAHVGLFHGRCLGYGVVNGDPDYDPAFA
jgi:hypothetical protein